MAAVKNLRTIQFCYSGSDVWAHVREVADSSELNCFARFLNEMAAVQLALSKNSSVFRSYTSGPNGEKHVHAKHVQLVTTPR